MIGRDGHRALAVVALHGEFKDAAQQYESVRALVHPGPFDLTFTGHLAFKSDLDHILQTDLRRAELVTIPLSLLVLLAVFGTLVASAVPVGVGGLAVVGGVAAVFFLSRHMDVAQYAMNIVTLIGTGVAIDYSLFIVSRYRDELEGGASVPDAVATAVATVGRAVAFSGLAVAVGLSGLLFYWGTYLSSIGMAGSVVVALAVLYALTFLPALLSVLGTRINKGRLPFQIPRGEGMWHAIANRVMARPLMILLPTLALLLLIGAPFLKLRMASADITSLPTRAEARQGFETLRREFPDQVATRIVVVARFPNSPVLTPDRVAALYDFSHRVRRLPGVTGVESVVDLDPRMSRDDVINLFLLPEMMFPPPLLRAIHDTVGDTIVVMAVRTNDSATSPQARAIVREIRRDRAIGDGDLLVTGWTATDVDAIDYIVKHTPRALMFVVFATYVILFLLLASVILPLKAVLMNLLSITGSFGALVWIFQEGHLSRLLHFSPEPVEPSLPVILFCAVFGLSMDYEVLLLTRMQEEYLRTGDNTHAVAEGLERSGRLITSAAAIMVAVFAAFSLADIVFMKAVGVGMALAVALDATLVRVLIVPATMRLFGDLNWWAPAWIQRVLRLERRKPMH
jgi:RND superfamily putative drug exporter